MEATAQGNFNDKVETIEGSMLKEVQADCPLREMFAPGVYVREVVMPKGALVVGHEHLTEHFNVLTRGKLNVMVGDDEIKHLKAGDIVVSKAGERKVFYVLEESAWITIHPTDETDSEKLEEMLVVQSPTYIGHQLLQKMKGEIL